MFQRSYHGIIDGGVRVLYYYKNETERLLFKNFRSLIFCREPVLQSKYTVALQIRQCRVLCGHGTCKSYLLLRLHILKQ